MNAQEVARILAKENDSVVVVGITREESGDLISDECFFKFRRISCSRSVREFSGIHFKNSKEEKLYRPHIERRQAVS